MIVFARPAVKALSQLAQVAPNAPTVFPGFPPGLTNHQAFVLALSAPPLSPLAPRPGYYNLAGSVTEDRFFYANEPLVHGNLATFFDYTPIRSLRDLSCGLAGETTFTNNLGSFSGPVIMFAGRAWLWHSDVQYCAVDELSDRDDQLQAGVWSRRLHVRPESSSPARAPDPVLARAESIQISLRSRRKHKAWGASPRIRLNKIYYSP